ncbi:MAG: hypothetical protein ABW252_06240 [Polyangiales bacterium]
MREIITPHEEPVQPVTEVKNALLQSSLSQLRASGLCARYVALVDPRVPRDIEATLAMSWVPVQLAITHYQACDRMALEEDALQALGSGVGDRMQQMSLVSSAKTTSIIPGALWASAGPLRRMWARHYRGGSVQVVKLGACEMELGLRGFVLNQFRYFRQAQLSAIAVAFAAIGARDTSVKLDLYNSVKDELKLRISWR